MENIIGVYGLGVMGASIALNMANHGYKVAVYNRKSEITKDFIEKKVKDQAIEPYYDIESFVASLASPKKIFLMVTAGKVVDMVIDQLLPLLEKGDIILDGGNSYYKDTQRRHDYCQEKGINYFGVGVSGGEMGALKGPSIMPSGDKDSYKYVEPILNDISAKCEDGFACCTYIGSDGSGHYVKMVHNGIEYGDIQIICEAYDLLRRVAKLSIEEIQEVFAKWNKGILSSYLVEITAKILTFKDEETGLPLVDVILDRAGQKGTGKWTSMEGLDLGVAIPTIGESVFARCMSAIKEERVAASKFFDETPSYPVDKKEFVDELEQAVYCAKIISYAQGFALLQEASKVNNWDLDYGKIALIWRAGCIIRADFLNDIKEAFDLQPNCPNLLMSVKFKQSLKQSSTNLRAVVLKAMANGIYVPALSSALEYYDGYRSEKLPANLLQAQRDFFGAHTYQRIDKDPNEKFHTIWEEE